MPEQRHLALLVGSCGLTENTLEQLLGFRSEAALLVKEAVAAWPLTASLVCAGVLLDCQERCPDSRLLTPREQPSDCCYSVFDRYADGRPDQGPANGRSTHAAD